MLNKKHRGIALAVSILFLFSSFMLGCGTPKTSSPNPSTQSSSNTPSPTTPTNPENTTPTPTPTPAEKVTLYFPTSDAAGLVPIEREIVASKQELIQGIFKEFSTPPSGLVDPLPKETTLLDAQIKDGVVTLNLSKNFKNNFEGGATGEQMVLFSIVNTLTSLPDIQSVAFLLDGEQTVAILGGLDTSTPIKRNESLILKQ